MKNFYKFLFIGLLLISQASFGQDTLATLNSNWNSLKTQLQKRTGIITKLNKVLSKSSKVNKVQLKKSKQFNVSLYNIVDSLNVENSLSIALASDTNDKLTQALTYTLVEFETDKNSKRKKDFITIINELESCENEIALAKRIFNISCAEYGKLNFLFGKQVNEKAVEVKF